MLQIKHILTLFFIPLFLFTGIYTNCIAQKNDNYHWFNITIQDTINTENNTKIISIVHVEDSIKSGTFYDFVNTHCSSLENGKITIGPFENLKNAQLSKQIYTDLDKHNAETDNEQDFYMFFIKPFKTTDANSIMIENIPARVTLCNEYLFTGILMEGFNFDKLAIGPFPKYELAEKAKYAFLRNSKHYLSQQEDSVKVEKLNKMLQKWEQLKIQFVKRKVKGVKDNFFYKFNIRFRKKYFQPDAIQVMLISPVYENIPDSKVYGTSLQGSEIKDNNRVIAFDKNTKYSEILNLQVPKATNLKGLTVEGFIYNQSLLIELPKRHVKIKK